MNRFFSSRIFIQSSIRGSHMKSCGCLGLPNQVLRSCLDHDTTTSSSKAHYFSVLILRGRSFFSKKVIDGFQQFSGHRHLGNGFSSPFGRPLIKVLVRRLAHGMVGCFHQGPSKPLRTLLGDMSSVRGLARGMNTWDQPGIGAKMFCTGEASDVADLADNQKGCPLTVARSISTPRGSTTRRYPSNVSRYTGAKARDKSHAVAFLPKISR